MALLDITPWCDTIEEAQRYKLDFLSNGYIGQFPKTVLEKCKFGRDPWQYRYSIVSEDREGARTT